MHSVFAPEIDCANTVFIIGISRLVNVFHHGVSHNYIFFVLFLGTSCLSDYNRTQTHNHLVRKRTLNHLVKLDSHLNFRYQACFEQESLDIQATIECGFTLKRVHDIIRTYGQNLVSLVASSAYFFCFLYCYCC